MAALFKGGNAVGKSLFPPWMQEELVDQMLGLGYVEGLSFKVKLPNPFFDRPLVYDRPLPRAATRRAERRARWRRRWWKVRAPYLEATRRLSAAWDALRGREPYSGWD